MRWIVAVIAALGAATAGRSTPPGPVDVPARDVATLAPSPAAIVAPLAVDHGRCAAAARSSAATAHRRDVRRDMPFIAAASPEIAAPSRTAVDATPRCTSPVSTVEPPVPCSRGPPRG